MQTDEKQAPQAALCTLSPTFFHSYICVHMSTRWFEFMVNFACLFAGHERHWLLQTISSFFFVPEQTRSHVVEQGLGSAAPAFLAPRLLGQLPVTPINTVLLLEQA